MLDALDNGRFFNNLEMKLFHFKIGCVCVCVFYNSIVEAVNQQGQWASGDKDGQCVIICY